MRDVAPPFDRRNALEDALVAAFEDPTARGPFLRLLLESTVYVIGEARDESGTPIPEGVSTVEAGYSLALPSAPLRDGVTATPFYSSEEWLSGCLRKPARFLTVPARTLFEITRGATLVLNWGAPWAKEFTPTEIEGLLDHGGASERLTVEESHEVLLGLPEVEPTALLAALTTVLSRHPEVSAGYLGWIHDPTTNVPAHAIIGLDGEGDLDAAIQDCGAAATGPEWPAEPVDFLRVTADDGGVSDFLLTGGKRFYARGEG